MLIASLKRKENIAEYLLYMWQIEDLIRANNLDIERIKETVINNYPTDEIQHRAMTEWYESLIDMMRREEVQKKGHLQMNKNIIGDLAQLHLQILADPKFDEYRKEFYSTLPFIVELRAKAGESRVGEIETCFNALYGMMLLRLRHQEISDETTKAIAQISRFIALLAKYYHLNEEDRLFDHLES